MKAVTLNKKMGNATTLQPPIHIIQDSDMTEKPKRLNPLPEILRALQFRSGNQCAFPGCDESMLSAEGVYIGQLCHIEAAEPGGERFNIHQNNEDRRAYDNLLYMCYPHHNLTNDTATYKVSDLRNIKENHEKKFSGRPLIMSAEPQQGFKPGTPILLLKNLDTGTQKWTRDYSIEIRQAHPALATFTFECTYGGSVRSRLLNYQGIFTSIKPSHFQKGDTVTITAELSPYDGTFLNDNINEPLSVECITQEGTNVIIELLFKHYTCEQRIQ